MPIPETHYARGSDVRIAYQVIGDGPIDLLFLQGGWYPVDLVWEQPAAERFIRRLASFSRVIMFDFRGWGASGADVGSPLPTAETWADDIRLVLDAVGSTQAAVVSSTIAVLSTLYFVAAHPDRVQGLVLVDGWARWHESEDYPDGMPVSVAARTNAGLTEHYGTGVNVRWLAPSVANDDEFVRWWGRCQRLANHPLQISRYWEEYSTRDYRSVLPSLRLPTLVLHHVDNPYIRFSHGSYLAEHIPGATLLPVPARTRSSSSGTSTRSSTRSKSFSPDGSRLLNPAGCWRLCCSPTSLAPPRSLRAWETSIGRSFWTVTTLSLLVSWTGTVADRSSLPVMACWPPSMARRARSAARRRSRSRSGRSAWRSEPASTPARSSIAATTSVASPYTSANGYRPSPQPERSTSPGR